MNKIFTNVFFIIVLVVAQTERVNASTDTDRLDLRIVVDISQHTRILLPRQNHLHALSVLIARLPDSVLAGVWSYGRYVNHLVQHGPVDHQWRSQAIAAVNRIRSVAQYTNLAEALNQASYDRRTAKGRRHILLIASANPEISDKPDVNTGQLQSVSEQLLPELIKAGFVVHTLAVGRQDTPLLQNLATQTGGLSLRLDSAESIDSLIEQVADNVLQSIGQPITDSRFEIDSSVAQLGALLFDASPHTRAHLQAPNGDLLGLDTDNAQSPGYQQLEGKSFRFIRVLSPAQGYWEVMDAAQSDSRIYIQSRQGLQVTPLVANHLADQPQPSSNSVVEVLPPPAQEPEVESVVGSVNGGKQFAARLDAFSGSGVYQLHTITGATQGQRNSDGAGQIIRRYALGVAKSHSDDLLQYNIRVLLDETGLRPDQSSLMARVARRGPENSAPERASEEWYARTVSKIGDGQWLLQLEDDGLSSYYEVDFDIGGVSLEGGNEQYRTKPLLIELERKEVFGVKQIAVDVNVSEPEIAAFARLETAPDQVLMSKFDPRKNVSRQGYERAIKTLVVAVVVVLMIVGLLMVWWRFRGKARPQASGVIASQELEISQAGPGAVVDADCLDPELKAESRAVAVILPVLIDEEHIENLFEAPPDRETIETDAELEEGMELAAEWGQLDIEPTKSIGEPDFHVPDKN